VGRAFRSLVAIYLGVGFLITLVTEVVAVMQGSSVVVGAFAHGQTAGAICGAVWHSWLVPIVTWPLSMAAWAYRELSARG